jgi:hypothetical protein
MIDCTSSFEIEQAEMMRKSVSPAHEGSEASIASLDNGGRGRRGRRQGGEGHDSLRGWRVGGRRRWRGDREEGKSHWERAFFSGLPTTKSPEALNDPCCLHCRNACARTNKADAIHIQGVDLSPEMWLVKMLLGPIDSSYDTKGERGVTAHSQPKDLNCAICLCPAVLMLCDADE